MLAFVDADELQQRRGAWCPPADVRATHGYARLYFDWGLQGVMGEILMSYTLERDFIDETGLYCVLTASTLV
jgi:hypothetical protein